MISKDLETSLDEWYKKIKTERSEIKYLGEKTVLEISNIIRSKDHSPVLLDGLRNIWYMYLPTKKGSMHMTIVQTDV